MALSCGVPICVVCAGAEDIGTWYLILEVMSVMAVICNSALIFFTGERFADHSMYRRTLYFIIFEHLVLGFKFAMAAFIPDVPSAVKIQLKRQDLLTAKVRPLQTNPNLCRASLNVHQELVRSTDLSISSFDLQVFEDQPDDDGEVGTPDNVTIDLSIFLTDDERLG